MTDFLDIAEGLRQWPDFDVSEEGFEWPIERRLARALVRLRDNPESVGTGDLVGLIRQVLRHESLRRGGQVDLLVPHDTGWPTRQEWEASGIEICADRGKSYRVRARPWRPRWLGDDFDEGPAIHGKLCRSEQEWSPADPAVVRDLEIEFFRSPGQAAAMRAVALLPRNQALVVGLPTGSGKSLLFQAAAVRAAKRNRCTVIVVPTTALAKDQEGRLRHLLSKATPQQAAYDLAYHGALSAEAKRAFRQRIKSGQQSVLIASPEAVVGALRFSLQKVAADGRLAWLVIDEAHMVSQWGDDFRPQFQVLAALAASWRGASPKGKEPRSLLLSATLTDDCVETLRTLFSPSRDSEEDFHILVAPELRSEPQYYVAAASDPAQRLEYVEEAVRHAPRPMIVYTAKRDDAAVLVSSLRARLHMRRIALFRGGDAGTVDGNDALERWNRDDIDVVVATSAFGLGMDNSDVRTVLHACVPETVDRFYQEVGRGGRDGRPSLALWIHAPEDRQIARRLGEKRLIGLERGWARWTAMDTMSHRVEGIDDAWSVRLDDTPTDRHEENDANRAWNVRTLTLMARAGLISLGTPRFDVPEAATEESEDEYARRCETAVNEALGRAVVVHETTISEDTWRAAVASSRDQAKAREVTGRQRLEELLAGTRPINEILKETYTLEVGTQPVAPTPHSGQCPITRGDKGADYTRAPAETAFTPSLLTHLAEQVRLSSNSTETVHWICYSPPESRRKSQRAATKKINSILRHLVRRGIVEVAVPEGFDLDRRLLADSSHGYVALRRLSDRDPLCLDGMPTELPLPRVTLLPFTATAGEEAMCFLDLDRPRHVIVIPESVRDPDREDRPLIATRPHDRLESLLQKWEL